MDQSERSADRLETAGIEFFTRVFNGYKQMAQSNPQRFCVIDAKQSIESIHKQIVKEVSKKIGL